MSASYGSKRTDAIVDDMKRLQDEKGLHKDRMTTARSSAGKMLIKNLEDEIASLRILYVTINTAKHSNIVATDLARLQGNEIGLTKQLQKWTNAKNNYERVDKELIMCQKELTVRTEQEQTRRV